MFFGGVRIETSGMKWVNSFVPNVAFPYPPKISENRMILRNKKLMEPSSFSSFPDLFSGCISVAETIFRKKFSVILGKTDTE